MVKHFQVDWSAGGPREDDIAADTLLPENGVTLLVYILLAISSTVIVFDSFNEDFGKLVLDRRYLMS